MSGEIPETLAEAALWYVEHGFAIIPIEPKGKRPYSQLVPHGLNDWTDNPEQVRQAWGAMPNLNIAIVCGTPSHGLLVLDFDVDEDEGKDGTYTLGEWETLNGELTPTVTAITGGGGMHYLYRTNRTNIRPSTNAELGVDVRCDGSYIVVYPSVHPSGRRYVWNEGDAPWEREISTADASVYDFLDHVQRNGGTPDDQPQSNANRFALPDRIRKGERNDVLYRYGCSLRSRGYPDDAIDAMVRKANSERCAQPMGEPELAQVIRQACKRGPGHNGEGTMRDDTGGLGKPGTSSGVRLGTSSKGNVLQTTANMLTAIGNDPNLAERFWYDAVAFTRMVTCPLPWDAREGERAITDEDYTGLIAYLERSYGLTSKERIIDACQFVCKEHERNPITEWLDSLEWDGEPRAGGMIVDALGADDTEYNRAVERLFMLGAVSRAYEPGCKFDYMPVLVGPQGIGKSRYVSLLAHIPAWYDDNFNTIDGDAAVEKLRGLWIAEMAELLATKKAREVEAIKAFITSGKDVIRPKYARETVQRLRVCVFIGTTNDHDFLTDSTGNRRFLPVECNATSCSPWLFDDAAEGHVEQMWAEIVHVYKTEHPTLLLPRHLMSEAQKLQEAHTEEHPTVAMARMVAESLWEQKAAPAYRGTPNERLCVREVFLNLPEDIQRGGFNQLVRRDIATALDADKNWKRIGKQRTQAYGRVTCWIPAYQ